MDKTIYWKISHKCLLEKNVFIPEICKEHPLQKASMIESALSKKSSKTNLIKIQTSFTDPLSGILDGSDPLGNYLNEDPQDLTDFKELRNKHTEETILGHTKFWNEHRANIFNKFHTKQQLTLASSFLSSPELSVVKVQTNIPDRNKWTGQTGAERVKARLEQLDSLDEGGGLKEMGGLSQEQFTQHLLALKEEMTEAWNTEQRVKALKIAIQCVKSLSLSPPELFYPYKFMIITDILDSLASLVHKRLNQILKSESSPIRNLSKLDAEETAKNWLYKIASVRELLPRLYLDAALLKCYSMFNIEDKREIYLRLIKSCRGIGDPIVGTYARMYIIRMGLDEQINDATAVILALEDLITCTKWGLNGLGIEKIEVMNEDVDSGRVIAERIFTPPVTWITQCLSEIASNEEFKIILKFCGDLNGVFCYILVGSLLQTFPPHFIASNSITFYRSIQQCYNFGEYAHEMLIKFGTLLNKAEPPDELKVDLLNGAWHLVTQIHDVEFFLKSASVWVQFTSIYFTWYELDKILGDILKRLSKFTSTDPHGFYPFLLQLITSALSYSNHTDELCNLASFQGLLSIFHRETMGSGSVGRGGVGVVEMKTLLHTALQHHSKEFTNPTIIRLFLSLFSSLHDGINALTTEDEKRQIALLVISFIRQVNLGKDFEQQLEFYVDARASFSSLDPVLEALVHHVCRLQVATLQRVKGRHTSRTASFERACTAYCFITIPSLNSSITRLKLYLLTGGIAMINNCMGQGDACIKSAVKEVLEISSELSESDSRNFIDDISSLSSFLVACPDPPESSQPLYLYRGLSKAIKTLNYLDSITYCKLNLIILKGVCAASMQALPYHIKDVEGNDTLYGGDKSIQIEAQNLCSELLAEILINIKKSSSTSETIQKSFLCEFLEVIFKYGDLSDSQMKNLTSGLILLIGKHKKEFKSLYENKLKELTS